MPRTAEDLLTEREEFMRLLVFDEPAQRPLDNDDDDPITLWGMGLCRLSWADESAGVLVSLREHVRLSTNPMKTLSDMRRLPFRFGALWINRNRDLHEATLRDMFRIVMERQDVGIDVRTMCLTYLIQQEDDDGHIATLLETAWEWLQETNDPNLIDLLWTHQNNIPLIQEWLDERRFDRIEPAAPTTEIIHREPSDGILNDNIYTDSQSVHTSTATQDFYESMARLLQEDDQRDTDPYNYAVSAMMDDERLFSDRILHDPTVFRLTNRTMRLVDIFGVIHRAALRCDSECALDRLVQEIDEANGTCSSGHAFRMVNALAGIHPAVRMRVSIESQVRVYLQEAVRSMATEDGLCWFQGDEFHSWVAHRLPHLVQCFLRHDRIGGRRTWLSEWARLFPTCTLNPYTLTSLIFRYPLSVILQHLCRRRP